MLLLCKKYCYTHTVINYFYSLLAYWSTSIYVFKWYILNLYSNSLFRIASKKCRTTSIFFLEDNGLSLNKQITVNQWYMRKHKDFWHITSCCWPNWKVVEHNLIAACNSLSCPHLMGLNSRTISKSCGLLITTLFI